MWTEMGWGKSPNRFLYILLKVHGWSLWFTKFLDLVPRFPKIHTWSLWFALCSTFSTQPFPKVHGWSLWFALCNTFSH
ncbi:hypothetical protein Hanom_Chr01g00075031 [Helianthus anomalus]